MKPEIITEEGNGNPFQYACLGNPMDRGAWWATVHGITQGWTPLKQLSARGDQGRNGEHTLHSECLNIATELFHYNEKGRLFNNWSLENW